MAFAILANIITVMISAKGMEIANHQSLCGPLADLAKYTVHTNKNLGETILGEGAFLLSLLLLRAGPPPLWPVQLWGRSLKSYTHQQAELHTLCRRKGRINGNVGAASIAS